MKTPLKFLSLPDIVSGEFLVTNSTTEVDKRLVFSEPFTEERVCPVSDNTYWSLVSFSNPNLFTGSSTETPRFYQVLVDLVVE